MVMLLDRYPLGGTARITEPGTQEERGAVSTGTQNQKGAYSNAGTTYISTSQIYEPMGKTENKRENKGVDQIILLGTFVSSYKLLISFSL